MKVHVNLRKESNDSSLVSSGIQRIGSLVRNVSQGIGIVRKSDVDTGFGSRLPVRWRPSTAGIIKAGAFVLVIAAAGVLISVLIGLLFARHVDVD